MLQKVSAFLAYSFTTSFIAQSDLQNNAVIV